MIEISALEILQEARKELIESSDYTSEAYWKLCNAIYQVLNLGTVVWCEEQFRFVRVTSWCNA